MEELLYGWRWGDNDDDFTAFVILALAGLGGVVFAIGRDAARALEIGPLVLTHAQAAGACFALSAAVLGWNLVWGPTRTIAGRAPDTLVVRQFNPLRAPREIPMSEVAEARLISRRIGRRPRMLVLTLRDGRQVPLIEVRRNQVARIDPLLAWVGARAAVVIDP